MARIPVPLYGRSPALDARGDLDTVRLVGERLSFFGPIPAGITVYRVAGAGMWFALPDPSGSIPL